MARTDGRNVTSNEEKTGRPARASHVPPELPPELLKHLRKRAAPLFPAKNRKRKTSARKDKPIVLGSFVSVDQLLARYPTLTFKDNLWKVIQHLLDNAISRIPLGYANTIGMPVVECAECVAALRCLGALKRMDVNVVRLREIAVEFPVNPNPYRESLVRDDNTRRAEKFVENLWAVSSGSFGLTATIDTKTLNVSLKDSSGDVKTIKNSDLSVCGNNPALRLTFADNHIITMVKEYALAFNKFGVSIDVESQRANNRVVFSDNVVDVVVHYRMILQEGMHNILKRFCNSTNPRAPRHEVLYPQLDPAEMRAITMCQKPLTNEGLMNADGQTNRTPEQWRNGEHVESIKAGIDYEEERLRKK